MAQYALAHAQGLGGDLQQLVVVDEFQAFLQGEGMHGNQAQAFLDWVLQGKKSLSDARYGLDVVAVLEAATRSMAEGGAMCPVDAASTAALCEAA